MNNTNSNITLFFVEDHQVVAGRVITPEGDSGWRHWEYGAVLGLRITFSGRGSFDHSSVASEIRGGRRWKNLAQLLRDGFLGTGSVGIIAAGGWWTAERRLAAMEVAAGGQLQFFIAPEPPSAPKQGWLQRILGRWRKPSPEVMRLYGGSRLLKGRELAHYEALLRRLPQEVTGLEPVT